MGFCYMGFCCMGDGGDDWHSLDWHTLKWHTLKWHVLDDQEWTSPLRRAMKLSSTTARMSAEPMMIIWV